MSNHCSAESYLIFIALCMLIHCEVTDLYIYLCQSYVECASGGEMVVYS